MAVPAIARCSGAALLLAAGFSLLSGPAKAETLAHLSQTVWGCVDPNEAASINDASNPARSDPRWLARTAADGQCVTLAPVGQWATLSESYNGLTYVGRRGAVGPSGSFWVPTATLVLDALPNIPATANPLPRRTHRRSPSLLLWPPSPPQKAHHRQSLHLQPCLPSQRMPPRRAALRGSSRPLILWRL